MRENKKVPDNEKSNQILNDVLEELHQKEIKRRSRGINETVTTVSIIELDRSISISQKDVEIILVKKYAC